MTPQKPDTDDLFDKFFKGSATPEEKILLWKWMHLLDMRQQATMYTMLEKEQIREHMRSNVLMKMKPAKPRALFILRYAAAAAILLMIGVGAFWFLTGDQRSSQPIASMVTAGDKMRSFYLPDSTQVILNMASSLEWNSDYNSTERKVVLKGEGYFKVHKDRQRPFVVESNGILTRALGTAFNIEAYQQESEVRVALLEGAVEVKSTSQLFSPKILEPGNLLRFRHQGGAAEIQSITAGNAIAWTTGGMSFHSISLTEALDRLASRYHIVIQYDRKKLQSKKVSGSFKVSPWEELLPKLLFIHNLHYKVKDNHILVY